ncbi:MAG: hypothetical protein V3W44_08450 [Dehalococcoidales bacterium]
MKAITTKYHGPTNTKPARVSASDMDGNRVMRSWPGSDTAEDNYRVALDAFLKLYDWPISGWYPGSVKGGMVWVNCL